MCRLGVFSKCTLNYFCIDKNTLNQQNMQKAITILFGVLAFFTTKMGYTQSTPTLAADIVIGATGSAPDHLVDFNGKLYFSADDASFDRELWVWDGENAYPIDNIYAGGSSLPTDMFVYQDKLYFKASNEVSFGELWVYDGIVGPTMIDNLYPGALPSNPSSFVIFNDTLYFSANDSTHGTELFKYGGSGTPTLVADIATGTTGSSPTHLCVFNDTLYFAADDGINGNELWKYTGVGVPSLVADIRSGGNSSSPTVLTVFNDKLCFVADNGTSGAELWEYDGMAAPSLVEDINSGSSSAFPLTAHLVVFQNKLYFNPDDGLNGQELWEYDGTNTPTMVHDIRPGFGNSAFPEEFVSYLDTLYFRANDGVNGAEIWKYDGTNTPEMLIDLASGSNASFMISPVIAQNKLFFSADDATVGQELWYIDNFCGSYKNLNIQACNEYTSPSGKIWDSSGVYLDTIDIAGLCDTFFTITLTIPTDTTILENITEVSCGAYTSPSGKTYPTTGIYIDSVPFSFGPCDSIIYTIDLTVNTPNIDGLVLQDSSTFKDVKNGAVAHGDVNNDGHLDVLLTGEDTAGKIVAYIYLNDGNGDFTELVDTSFQGTVQGSASLIDYDKDGFDDVFISGDTINATGFSFAGLYQNNGDSTFTQVTSAPFDNLTGGKHTFTDVDTNGFQDLIIASSSGIDLYLNTSGSFSATPNTISNSFSRSNYLLVGDLNGDTLPDLIAGRADFLSAIPELYLNDGNGNFTLEPNPFDILALGNMVLMDVGSDGDLDVVSIGINGFNPISYTSMIYTNDGLGNFSRSDSTSIHGLVGGAMTPKDVDNDGDQDLLLVGTTDLTTAEARLYLQFGNGQFDIVTDLPMEGNILNAATFFDRNQDGTEDLFVIGSDQYYSGVVSEDSTKPISTLFDNKGCYAACVTEGEINITQCDPYTMQGNGQELTSSGIYFDVLKDGNAVGCDSIIRVNYTRLETTMGNITRVACDSFIAPSGKVIYESGTHLDTLADANYLGCDSIINISLNVSQGNKTTVVSYLELNSSNLSASVDFDFLGTEFADFDNDDNLDILFYGDNKTTGKNLILYRNIGNGNFSSLGQIGATFITAIRSVEVADMVDEDDKPDILIAGYDSLNQLRVELFKNIGGTPVQFTKIESHGIEGMYSGFFSVSTYFTGFVDADARLDVFVIGTNNVKIYKNMGGGVFSEFTSHGIPPTMGYYNTSTMGDIDNDGDADILISGVFPDYKTKLYINDGSGAYTEDITVDFNDTRNGSIHIVNTDEDLFPEVLISQGEQELLSLSTEAPIETRVTLYKNNGNGSFTPNDLLNGHSITPGPVVIDDMNGDNRPDILLQHQPLHQRDRIHIFMNDGIGNFEFEQIIANTAHSVSGIALGDIDNDGSAEIFYKETSSEITQPKLLQRNVEEFSGTCIAPTGCGEYISPSGKKYTASGVYQDTLPATGGGDSLITVNLLIDSLAAYFTIEDDPNQELAAIIVNRAKGKNKTYLWDFGDNNTTTAKIPGNHTYATAGTYNICLTVSNSNCDSTYCEEITVGSGKIGSSLTIGFADSTEGSDDPSVGIETPAAGGQELSFNLFPNPTTDVLNIINNNGGQFDIVVKDISGREVLRVFNQEQSTSLDMSMIKPGLYMVEVWSDGKKAYYKVMKD